MRNYKNYQVWLEAHQLVMFVYAQVAPHLPNDEKFEMKSQMKRAAYSIPFNIVEGCGRNSDRDFSHFLDVALGSTHELEYSCLLGAELHYIDPKHYEKLNKKINIIKAMLINLIKSIRVSSSKHLNASTI